MVTRERPRLTFSALCEYLQASPVRQRSILFEQKYPKDGPILSYAGALRQLTDLAVDGRPLDPFSESLRPHEQELLSIMVSNGWSCPMLQAERPAVSHCTVCINGVDISCVPDLMLSGRLKKGRIAGALKFYCSKTRPLGPNAGKWMASLLYYHLADIQKAEGANANYCMVYEPRKNTYYRAGRTQRYLFRNVESACATIRAVWPTV